MKKIIILIVLIVIIGLGYWFSQEENNNLVYSNENEEITVKSGDKFTIALESNPTTGFSWMDEIKQNKVSFIEKEFISSQDKNDTEIVGVGGIEYFTYQAGEKGESYISFMYARPWESVQPLERKEFHIIIE